MKKTLISICIIILLLSLGLTSVSAFDTKIIEKVPSKPQEKYPTGIGDLFVKINLGTYKIEMKEPGQGHDVDEYPFTFDINSSGLSKPTVKINVKNKYLTFPMLQPEVDVVFIDNRPVHPAYNITIVFYASGFGPEGTDFDVDLNIMVEENQIGELRETIGISNTTAGFSPFPWQDKTYYPKIAIYKNSYDYKNYKTNLLHTDRTEFNVDVTINKAKQKGIQYIWSFPFLHLLKTIFKK